MDIIYTTVKAWRPLSDQALKDKGSHGWILGGIAHTEETFDTGEARNVRRTVFFYHFWKKKEQS